MAQTFKANIPEERTALRAVLARSEEKYIECPCGWFYQGARCPDKSCAQWKQANGKKKIKLYAHADEDTAYDIGRTKLGLEDEALENFSRWGYELEFEVEVDVETGNVTLLTVDGHKIFPVRG